MSKHAREDARKRIVNFYNDDVGGNFKCTVNYFVKQGMKRRTVSEPENEPNRTRTMFYIIRHGSSSVRFNFTFKTKSN